MSVYGISYTSRSYSNRQVPVTNMGMNLGFFEYFKCFTEEDIPVEFKEKYKTVWEINRGGGCWIWKPYLIKNLLDNINFDDIIVYFDSGCELNVRGKQRYNEYLSMVKNDNTGIVRFGLGVHLEKNFTNSKTVEYFKTKFNIDDETMESYLNSSQLVGGILFVRKTEKSVKFFETLLEILDDDQLLYCDYYNKVGEVHRQDQSISSMLCKVMNAGTIINKDETWFNFGDEESLKYPIWAMRKMF